MFSLRALRGGMDVSEKKSSFSTEPLGESQEELLQARSFENACMQFCRGESTEKLREAEDYIRAEVARPGSLRLLLHVISSSQEANVRQLGSILLRKVLKVHWVRFVKQGLGPTAPLMVVKQTLLSLIINENERMVRRAHAAGLAALTQRLVKLYDKQQEAEEEGEEGELLRVDRVVPDMWKDIAQVMVEGVLQPDPKVRETVMVLHELLAREAARWVSDAPPAVKSKEKKKFSTLPSMEPFASTLVDQDVYVRKAALSAANAMLESFLEYELPENLENQISKLLPILLESATKLCDDGDDLYALKAISCIDTLICAQHKSVKRYFSGIIDTLAHALRSDSLTIMSKKSVAEAVSTLLALNREDLTSGGHITRLAEPLFRLSYDALQNGFEDCDDDNFWTVFTQISENLPEEQGFNLMAPLTVTMAENSETHVRAAGLYVMSLLVDGLKQPLSELDADSKSPSLVQQMLPFAVRGLSDPSPLVSEAALRATASFIQALDSMFPPEGYKTVFPETMRHLGGENPNLIRAAHELTCKFIEHMSPEQIIQATPEMLRQAQETLSIGSTKNHTETMKCGMKIASDLAEKMQEQFAPYFPQWYEMLQQIMIGDNIEALGAAVTTTSSMALAIGRGHFEPHMKQAMRLAERSLSCNDHPQVQSAGIFFFASMCELLGTDTETAMPTFVDYLINSIRDTNLYHLVTAKAENAGADLAFEIGEDNKEKSSEQNNNEATMDADDEIEVDDRINPHEDWHLDTNNIDKVSTAVVALDFINNNAPMVVVPHLIKALDVLMLTLPTPSQEISWAVFDCVQSLFNIGMLYIKEHPENMELNLQLKTAAAKMNSMSVSIIEHDDNLGTVARAVRLIGTLIDMFGTASLAEGVDEKVMDSTDNLLHGMTQAQYQYSEMLKIQPSPKGESAMNTVRVAAVEMVIELMKKLEPSRALTLFTPVDKTITAFIQGGYLNAGLIGRLMQILANLGPNAEPLMPSKFPLILEALKDEKDHAVRKAAVEGMAYMLVQAPSLVVGGAVDGVDRTAQILPPILSVATQRPYVEDGSPPDPDAQSAFSHGMVTALWLFVARHTRGSHLPGDTAAKIQSAADASLYATLQSMPFEGEKYSLSVSACLALERLFDRRDPTLMRAFNELGPALTRTVERLNLPETPLTADDPQDDLKPEDRQRVANFLERVRAFTPPAM